MSQEPLAINRRNWMRLSGAALAMRSASAQTQQTKAADHADLSKIPPDKLLLKDYRPKSIYKIPQTEITRAKFPVIDVHCHGARPAARVSEMLKNMDAVGLEKSVIFTGAATTEKFIEVSKPYTPYPERFFLWCGLDLSGADEPGFGAKAVKSLEGCHQAGAVGVGEITDKGYGLGTSVGSGPPGWPGRGKIPAKKGPHPDDPRMDALFGRCGELGMPVNIHVCDPIWGYLPQDYTNDGLMDSFDWRLDDKPGILGHDGLIASLEGAVRKHPRTIFIACHFANLDYDLTRLRQMFERNANFYADISARYAETAAIPRFVSQFYRKYSDRLLYGTDLGFDQDMYRLTFRFLETEDEHFYQMDEFNHHWPLHCFGLPDNVLKRVYRENALAVFEKARNKAKESEFAEQQPAISTDGSEWPVNA
jgi:hypothetical protein